MKIKAVSLWEPYASLMRVNAKKNETRHWATSYRGPLLICAAKKMDAEYLEMLEDYEFQAALQPLIASKSSLWVKKEDLNFGMAVCVVNQIGCVSTNHPSIVEISKHEMQFGNYASDRFAWVTRMINNSFEPFPVKGAQGFFEVEIPEGLV